jgi:pimeloyl-ACP methyl ester carboxylesterase
MTVWFRGEGDMRLAADVEGPWSGPPVILLHGGGQTRHAWKRTTELLGGEGYLAIALDLRGHGESSWSPDADYRLQGFAADVRALAKDVGRTVALVGASLGGMSSLIAAGEAPRVDCSALVLVDVTPRIDPDGAARIGSFMQSAPNGFASLDEAADAVAEFLPHRTRPSDTSGLAKNLRLGEDGRFHWHWDPGFLNGGPRDMQEDRLEAAARGVKAPMLLVRGASSEIVSEEGAAAFLALRPDAEFVDVPEARHMVAGDRNDVFTAAVVEFLERVVAR